jgi:hypothetical protein
MTTFDEMQDTFRGRHPDVDVLTPRSGTIVVLPSLTVSIDELRRLLGMRYYEERMLFLLLALRHPQVRICYLTSTPVDEAIVEHYLGFLPDPASARKRLHLFTLDDPSPSSLTDKLLRRPDVIQRIRALGVDAGNAWVLPFIVTPSEAAVAQSLDLPLYGPGPGAMVLGSKSGARQVARRAGVSIPRGYEHLWSIEEAEAALQRLCLETSGSHAVVKLNDGFSGLGNVVVEVDPGSGRLVAFSYGADGESWASFGEKIGRRGAVAEELIGTTGTLASPSVLVQIRPGGSISIVGSHDQILGGPNGQVYLGCGFPADRTYREIIHDCGARLGKVLANEGVIGLFGLDFLVVQQDDGSHQAYLGEINLRLGGTTHPLGMTLLATGATYDGTTGELLTDGRSVSYVATDNLKSEGLIGLTPAEVIARLEKAGLEYRPASGSGIIPHMLGAVPALGKMGLTCIGTSRDAAHELYARAQNVIATWKGP